MDRHTANEKYGRAGGGLEALENELEERRDQLERARQRQPIDPSHPVIMAYDGLVHTLDAIRNELNILVEVMPVPEDK